MTDAEKLAVALVRGFPNDPHLRERVSHLTDEQVLMMGLSKNFVTILRREGAVISKGGGPLV